jgi:hypothetical protein
VVERHIVQGLEEVFSPLVVTALDGAEVYDLASEQLTAVRQREHQERRRSILENGQNVFSSMLMHRT